MKFSKTYLQTMTDPAFPKEWRDKGLEYKELKKLINGVVAELEGLGLSADVLRDLLEPPEQAKPDAPSTQHESGQASSSNSNKQPGDFHDGIEARDGASQSAEGDEVPSSLVAGLARLSTGRPAPSDFVDPLSPLMEEDEARRRSQEGSMKVPVMTSDDMPAPAMSIEQALDSSTDTPAGEWISHLEHARRDQSGARRQGRRTSSSRRRDSNSGSSADAGGSSRESSVPLAASGKAVSDNHLKVGDATEQARASPMTMLGIRKRRESSDDRTVAGHSSSSSFGAARDPSPSSSWRMGRKDLRELRNNEGRPSMTQRLSDPALENDQEHDWQGHAWRERQGLGWDQQADSKGASKKSPQPRPSTPLGTIHTEPGKARWVQGKDGRRARAEYELGGSAEHPIPRIRLTIESPINSDNESESDTSGDEGDEGDEPYSRRNEQSSQSRITELPPSPRVSVDLSAAQHQNGNNAPYQHAPATAPPQMMRTREIVIPLTADTQFLDTLTHSLTQLSELQTTQKEQFITSTEDLCASVARAASPYASKNDLYIWREIFQLWVDMQIFESQREKDRGELSVDESEARLKRFAQELVKRGWLAENSASANGSPKLSRSKEAMQQALTVPMKDSRSVGAVEDFLRLNLALLDVKKFQRVNVEAARKILKKHDKRTALTASSGLRNFVQQQDSVRFAAAAAASMGMHLSGLGMPAESTGALVAPASGTHPSLAALLPSSTTGLLSESLPHILLSLLTTTLLPILPSVDDYSCAICTGLAWRPIRLDCSHLFCIRCLVKLQKSGKKDCPLCRAPNVVASADGRNMDPATVNMLKMWFPHEVSEKDHENENDRKKEELAELGFEQHKCVVM